MYDAVREYLSVAQYFQDGGREEGGGDEKREVTEADIGLGVLQNLKNQLETTSIEILNRVGTLQDEKLGHKTRGERGNLKRVAGGIQE